MSRRERIILVDKWTGEINYVGLLVSKRSPCPICGKPDWCTYDQARGLAVCERVTSGRRIGDAGWMHTIGLAAVAVVKRAFLPKPEPEIDAEGLAKDYQEEISPDLIEDLVTATGISRASLERLEVGWNKWAFTFPMKEPTGVTFRIPANPAGFVGYKTIGIRTRNLAGEKYAITGSRNGLFIPRDFPANGTLLIVEGPTDTGAMLDLGYDAIGRPNSGACVDMTVRMCRGRDVVILANKDEAKTLKSGERFYPGQDGAERLADALIGTALAVKVILPLVGKDARQWKESGATRDVIDTVIRSANFWKKGDRIIQPEQRLAVIEW